jgi:asparagine synthase (glutamine-hydrolysing)
MPGIVGIIGGGNADESSRAVQEMLACMHSESWYVSGSVAYPDAGVWAGWVAHADSFAARNNGNSNGNGNGDGKIGPSRVLVAGENLGASGSCPSGEAQPGNPFIGPCSGVAVDPSSREVVLFSDILGIERIYVCQRQGRWYFASEAKALLQVVPECRAFDEKGLLQFLRFGCTLDGRTIFRDVALLPAATTWRFIEGKRQGQDRYFAPASWESQTPLDRRDFEIQLREALGRAVTKCIGQGETVGISLTGGLDTRMIMASLPSDITPPLCYTFAGMSEHTVDAELASRVARACGFTHRVLRLEDRFFDDFGEHLDQSIRVTDGCADATITHELFLNRLARQYGSVRLTGNFGGEVLRGVSTFKQIPLEEQLIARSMLDASWRHIGAIPDGPLNPVTFAAFKEVPDKFAGVMAAARSQVILRTPFLDWDVIRLAYRAPDARCRSERAALDLVHSRNPTLSRIETDKGLKADFSPADPFRRLSSRIAFKLDYFYQQGLPRQLEWTEPCLEILRRRGRLGRHKYLPYRVWFRRELAGLVRERVTDESTLRLPMFDREYLRALPDLHIASGQNRVSEISAVLTLEAVSRLILRPGSPSWTSDSRAAGAVPGRAMERGRASNGR